MDLKPKFQFDEKPAKNDENLPKFRLEGLPAVNQRAEQKPEQRPEIRQNDAELAYLQKIADNTRAIKGWITFIGVLIIIGLVVQLINSCMASISL